MQAKYLLLEEEKIICVDKELYSTDRIYKINFTDDFLKEIEETDNFYEIDKE